jgi:DNA-binding NarL/FixJ family response regulator
MLIFLAEPDQNLRLGLQMLLQQEAGLHVIGMAVKSQGLVAQLEASQAEVLILDWHLPGAPMQTLVAQIRELESPPKIIALSVRPEDRLPALSAGAVGFISKAGPPDDMLPLVRSMKHTINSEG